MNSAVSSAVSSALASSQSSRSPTPLPIQAPNPYRLPRFWRGYALGGLTVAGAYGLYKLGSALNNKFHKQQSTPTSPYIRYQQSAEPTPTPEPTPYKRRNIRLHDNFHYH